MYFLIKMNENPLFILSIKYRPVYYYVFAVFTTLFYSKLRPTFEPDYSTLEQTSFQNLFVQKGTYRDWSLRET